MNSEIELIQKKGEIMNILKKITCFIVGIFLSISQVYAAAVQEIIVWHGLGGELGKHYQTLVDNFNQQLKDKDIKFSIKPENKGRYEDVLTTYEQTPAEQRPDIVQVYEMGTRVMLETKEQGGLLYVPLPTVMAQANLPFNDDTIIPQIREFYRAGNPQLSSLPFNASTVVLYYNKTALDKAGLTPLETFEEFAAQMAKLQSEKQPVGLGAGWLSGHHIDQIGARQNKRIATFGNGVDSPEAQLDFDPFFSNHLTALKEWYEKGWFSLDQGPAVEQAFADGKIVYLSQGGNRHSDISKLVDKKFEIGVVAFPYWQSMGGVYNTIAGGGSFWISNKPQTPERLQIIAQFLQFLASAEVQAQWQRLTGYIPVTEGAQALNEKSGYFDAKDLGVQAAKIAYESFTAANPAEFSRGILLPNFPKIRDIEIDQMTRAIKGEIAIEKAMSTIQEQGNKLLSKQ